MKYSIGDTVELLYITDNDDDEDVDHVGETGTITDIDDDDLLYQVEFDDEYANYFREDQLKLITPKEEQPMATLGWQVGDKLTIADIKQESFSRGCGAVKRVLIEGGYGLIRKIDSDGEISVLGYTTTGSQEGECKCWYLHHLNPKKEGSMTLQTLTERQKQTLDTDTQALIEAGVLNNALDFTSEGKSMLVEYLFETNRKAFAKVVADKVAVEKKSREAVK